MPIPFLSSSHPLSTFTTSVIYPSHRQNDVLTNDCVLQITMSVETASTPVARFVVTLQEATTAHADQGTILMVTLEHAKVTFTLKYDRTVSHCILFKLVNVDSHSGRFNSLKFSK